MSLLQAGLQLTLTWPWILFSEPESSCQPPPSPCGGKLFSSSPAHLPGRRVDCVPIELDVSVIDTTTRHVHWRSPVTVMSIRTESVLFQKDFGPTGPPKCAIWTWTSAKFKIFRTWRTDFHISSRSNYQPAACECWTTTRSRVYQTFSCSTFHKTCSRRWRATLLKA